MTEFSVGSIIYVAIEKRAQILPALIVEKIVKERPNGAEVYFGLQFPNTDEIKTVAQSANMFGSLGTARDKMIERLTKNIESVCDRAKGFESELQSLRAELFNEAHQTASELSVTELSGDASEQDMDAVMVDMPDGTKARVRMPKELA